MIKYASNALLATAISFSNEIGNLCARAGRRGRRGRDGGRPRVVVPDRRRRRTAGACARPSPSFLAPGCGFGGSCLPKDVKALVAHGERPGAPMPLLRVGARRSTRRSRRRSCASCEKHFRRLAGLRVGVLGLAFKPDTDDVRESPAIPVIRSLLARNASVKAYDPVAMPEARKVAADARRRLRRRRWTTACEDVDAVVLLTRWKQFESVPALLAAAGTRRRCCSTAAASSTSGPSRATRASGSEARTDMHRFELLADSWNGRRGSSPWAPTATTSRSAAGARCCAWPPTRPGLEVLWVVFCSSRRAPSEARASAQAFLRGRGRLARRRARLPGRLPALLGAGGEGSVRGPQEGLLPGPGLHPLPRGPAPGPPPGLGPHLEHLARPPDPRIRDPEVRRRLRLAELLLALPARDAGSQDRPAPRALPLPGGPASGSRATCSRPSPASAGWSASAPDRSRRPSTAARSLF